MIVWARKGLCLAWVGDLPILLTRHGHTQKLASEQPILGGKDGKASLTRHWLASPCLLPEYSSSIGLLIGHIELNIMDLGRLRLFAALGES